MIRIFNLRCPSPLYKTMLKQSYQTSRHSRLLFFDLKIGRQDFWNKVSDLSRRIDFDWHFKPLNPDLLRVNLKNCFLKYPTSNVSIRSTAANSTYRLPHQQRRHANSHWGISTKSIRAKTAIQRIPAEK